jgi:hypothetical protein
MANEGGAVLATLERLADAAERCALALEELAARGRAGGDARTARLAAAIYATLGDSDFGCAELVELASASSLPTRRALQAALGDASAKALGKLLAEHAGAPLDGLRIERVGRRRWRVCAFETAQTRAGFNPWRT